MDKRVYFWASLIIVLIIVLIKTPLLYLLLSLFIVGVIPGTDLKIPAWVILTIYPLLFIYVLVWLSTRSLMVGEAAQPPIVKKAAAKKRPKPTRSTRSKSKKAAPKRRTRPAV